MSYNIRLVGPVLLLVGFIYLTLEGILVIRRASIRIPFRRREYFEGNKAKVIGGCYFVFGIYCLYALVSYIQGLDY